MVQLTTLIAVAATSFALVYGVDLDVTSTDSIKSAASKVVKGLVSSYHGTESGHVIGVLETPYLWWEVGAVWDTLIQYWALTGDSQYNGIVSQALSFQQGDHSDYLPANFSNRIGNDDQATWALAAMTAAEFKFPNPDGITWITLAENVFNEQVLRWDPDTCKGGLRWQIFPFVTGYAYKNSAANGNFFRLAARLARYTGNSTYSDWASKTYDWVTSVALVDDQFSVFDGTSTESDCTSINKLQFSMFAGTYISGAANMYNITTGDDQDKWKTILDGLLKQNLDVFFPDGIAKEVACEPKMTCTVDMKSFKGLLGQDLVNTIKVAPYTAGTIMPLLTSSAEAAAKHCGSDGLECELQWYTDTSSHRSLSETAAADTGVGEQISALSYLQGLLVNEAAAPVTEGSGGSSASSPTSTSGASQSGTSSTSLISSGTGTSSSPTGTGTGTSAGNAMGIELGMIMAAAGLIAVMLL